MGERGGCTTGCRLMAVDLLAAEGEGAAATFEDDLGRAQDTGAEGAGGVEVARGQAGMIEAVGR